MNKILSLLIIVLTLSFFGCENENTTSSQKIDSRNFLNLGSQNDPVLTAYINSFDWSGVSGVITLQKTFTNDMDGSTPYQAFTNNGYARFYDLTTGEKRNMDLIAFNDLGLVNIDNFEYQIHPSEISNLILNYGTSTNNIYILQDSTTNILLDSNISISSPIQLTGFTYNQNVSKNSNFSINWSGSLPTTSVTQFSLRTDSSLRDVDTTSNVAGIRMGYCDNTGSFTLVKEAMANLRLGKTRILANKIELKMINLSNGQKVCLVANSTYDSYVNITN